MIFRFNRCICGWSAVGEYTHCPECGVDLILLARMWQFFQGQVEDGPSMSPHHHDLSEFESEVRERSQFFDSNTAKELRLKSIRAEVEAMDWPEVIGE